MSQIKSSSGLVTERGCFLMSKNYVLSRHLDYMAFGTSDNEDRWVVEYDSEALRSDFIKQVGGANAFAVLSVIVAYMDRSGESFPTQKQIAKAIGCSDRTVMEAVKKLVEAEVDGAKLIHKELVGGAKKHSVYKLFFPEDEATEKKVTAKDVLIYFAKKYEETYGVIYNVTWARDTSMVKKKLMETYTPEQIFKVIDVIFEEFDNKWSNPKYPRPTVGSFCSWLFNSALAELDAKEKEEQRLEIAMNRDTTEEDDLFDKYL